MEARGAGRVEGLDEVMAEVFRSMTGAERLRVASGMFASARRMLRCHLRTLHPEWTDAEVDQETSSRLSLGTG